MSVLDALAERLDLAASLLGVLGGRTLEPAEIDPILASAPDPETWESDEALVVLWTEAAGVRALVVEHGSPRPVLVELAAPIDGELAQAGGALIEALLITRACGVLAGDDHPRRDA